MRIQRQTDACIDLEHLLGPLDIEQDVGEGADGVGVPAHHHVRKPSK